MEKHIILIQELKKKNLNLSLFAWATTIIIIGLMVLGRFVTDTAKAQTAKVDSLQSVITYKENYYNKKINSLFSLYNLKQEIKSNDILFSEIVIKQAILETNFFTADCFMEYNNLFGFTNKKMLHFDSWIDCVIFYAQWQKKYYHGSITNSDEYYEFLKHYPFATDVNYIKKLKGVEVW